MTGRGDLDPVRQLEFVLLTIAVKPDADQALEPRLPGDRRYQLVAFAARESAYPLRVRTDDSEAIADLFRGHLRAGSLALRVRAEGDAMDLRLENLLH